MPKPKKSLVFFGNERLATGVNTEAWTLKLLTQAGYDIKAVISNYSTGQSRKARTLEIAQVAKQNHIPIWLPEKLSDIKSQLESLKAEIGILVAFGKIVPQSIIDIFPKGIVNLHPSLLPLHRGPTPIESTILNGERQTGVSLMRLVKDMDAGPVYAQSAIDLKDSENKQALADRLLELGGTMLIELLPQILDGQVVALPQDDSHATYDNLISAHDGVIDWQKPAERLEREVRAYAGWPKSRTKFADLDVVILKARVVSDSGRPGSFIADKHRLAVTCGQDALDILELQPANKQAMDAQAFLNGYGQTLISS